MAPAAIGIRLVGAIPTLLLAPGALALLGWLASPASAEWLGDLYARGAFTKRADLNVGGDTFRNVGFETSGLVGGRVGYWIRDFEYLGMSVSLASIATSSSAPISTSLRPPRCSSTSGATY